MLYAGSLVPRAVVAAAPTGAQVVDTAPLTLDEIIGADRRGRTRAGQDVARVHSGDPSLYGAIAEQMRRLDALGIPYDVTPGVPAFAAAAAALKTELTLPEVSQTVILTRTDGKASPMPPARTCRRSAPPAPPSRSICRSATSAASSRELTPHYGADCPVVVAYRVSWPDEQIIRGTLADIAAKVKAAKITRTALILVGRVFAAATSPTAASTPPTIATCCGRGRGSARAAKHT